MNTGIVLSRSDLIGLRRLVSQGTASARVIRRANILLLLHQGRTRAGISEITGAGVATVGRTKRAYLLGGLDNALYEKSRSGRPTVYGDEVKKKIVALACTDPPAGFSRWTAVLLVEHCNLNPRPSRDKVRLILKEDGLKPWREKNVVRSKSR